MAAIWARSLWRVTRGQHGMAWRGGTRVVSLKSSDVISNRCVIILRADGLYRSCSDGT